MNKLLASLTIALFAQAAHADVVKVDFTTAYDWQSLSTTDSFGSLTLSLNQDGTVAAKFDPTSPTQTWMGIAIDSTWEFRGSNSTQGSSSGWGLPMGEFETGLFCNSNCVGSVSWTISGNKPLTSVRQLLTGGGSVYDATVVANDEYVGNAVDVSAVPEPASLALLGLGLAGFGIARRRSSRTLPA